MKFYFKILLLFSLALTSCSSIKLPRYTREEVTDYSVIKNDTTISYLVKNAPGTRDGNQINRYTKEISKYQLNSLTDSAIIREYPDYIRLGLLETAGLIGGKSVFSTGFGMFGIHPNLGEIGQTFRGSIDSSNIFTGGLYRIGIAEKKLNIFENEPNWTYGTHALELIMGDARLENALISIMPIYLRKRIYLRENIPFVAVTFAGGVGYYPSQYVNVSTSLDCGSLGGLNLRFYLGYALGANPAGSPQIRDNEYAEQKTNSVSIPYVGLGISFMDFIMLERELNIEMKDQAHSAWDLGIAQVGLFFTGAPKSVFNQVDTLKDDNIFFKSFAFKLLNADCAIPFIDSNFFIGTSFLSMNSTGKNEWGISILPIRAGYYLEYKSIQMNPFIEVSILPSVIFNLGARIKLFRFGEKTALCLAAGYMVGNSNVDNLQGGFLNRLFGNMGSFSNFYIGLSVNIYERLFSSDELRYFKK